MALIIYFILCGVSGAVLASAGVTATDWQFWVETGCVCGACICGQIIRYKGGY